MFDYPLNEALLSGQIYGTDEQRMITITYFVPHDRQTSGSHSTFALKQEHLFVPHTSPVLAHVHPFHLRRPGFKEV